jgi:hypothetical protein
MRLGVSALWLKYSVFLHDRQDWVAEAEFSFLGRGTFELSEIKLNDVSWKDHARSPTFTYFCKLIRKEAMR